NFSGLNMAYTRYTSSPAQTISMMIGSTVIGPQRTCSQKRTYASEIRKNKIVTPRKIASCMVSTPIHPNQLNNYQAPSFRPHHQTNPSVAVFCSLRRIPCTSDRNDG